MDLLAHELRHPVVVCPGTGVHCDGVDERHFSYVCMYLVKGFRVMRELDLGNESMRLFC